MRRRYERPWPRTSGGVPIFGAGATYVVGRRASPYALLGDPFP
jgi:hypothetical protein